jgi:hypothetical protein
MAGFVVSFGLLIYAGYELWQPTDVGKNGTIKAIPDHVQAGQIVSYKINDCQNGKFNGITSVNIQSTDEPPSVTVAVAAPSPQRIYCSNALLVPGQLPTGDYRLLILVTYNINPVRNALNPIIRAYRSQTIHVTNKNPNFVLPKDVSNVSTDQASEHVASTSVQPAESPQRTASPQPKTMQPQTTTPTQSTTNPQTNPVKQVIDHVLVPVLGLPQQVIREVI